MFPPARTGDPITQDKLAPCGLIGPRAPGPRCVVIIEGAPAARLGDFVDTAGCGVFLEEEKMLASRRVLIG